MTIKTLAALKEENTKAEIVEEEAPQAESETKETEVVEVETEETSEVAELSEEETEDAPIEAWMQSDEQTLESDDKKFTNSDIGIVKRKLRAKLERKHDGETEALKARIVELEGNNQPAQPSVLKMPTLESSEFDEGKHEAAMNAWIEAKTSASMQAYTQTNDIKTQQTQAATTQDQAVDDHYTRAAKLAQDSGISPELYRSADLAVRQTIESVLPQQGDAIMDSIISRLGEGSEKVMYYLGRNRTAQDKLRSEFIKDPTGLSAMMFLGELKTQTSPSKKRVSQAKAPAPKINGDNASAGATENKFIKRYKAASNDVQTRIDIKREAKKAGFNKSIFN